MQTHKHVGAYQVPADMSFMKALYDRRVPYWLRQYWDRDLIYYSSTQGNTVLTVKTPDGNNKVILPNDWIVRLPDGTHQVVKPDDFKKKWRRAL